MAMHPTSNTRPRPNQLLRLGQLSMMAIQYTDAAFTSFNAAIVYNERRAMGMDQRAPRTYVGDKMEEAVNRYAQSTGFSNRSLQD